MTLERLALSRSTLDRAAHRRLEPGLVEALLAEPETLALVLHGDRAPVHEGQAAPHLVRLAPDEAAAVVADLGGPAVTAYLGDDADARAHVLLAVPAGEERAAPAGARWAGLREVGSAVDDTDAGLLTTAIALANWHGVHGCCARCGAATDVTAAGWSRTCPACGAEHYPRTDPAVIMAVVDAQDRLLLGRQARWPEKRFSTLAGFVEPGESLEAAVRREVFEESAVRVGEVEYRGSQPWPFPSSLMLGFLARATSTEVTVDGDELAQARWWTREELALDVATEELLLPPPVSIARRLIEDWFGGPIQDAGGIWR